MRDRHLQPTAWAQKSVEAKSEMKTIGTSALIGAVIALGACSRGMNHRTQIRRATARNGLLAKSTRSNMGTAKDGLPIQTLVKELTAASNRSYIVFTEDIDYGSLTTNGFVPAADPVTRAIVAFKNNKPVLEAYYGGKDLAAAK